MQTILIFLFTVLLDLELYPVYFFFLLHFPSLLILLIFGLQSHKLWSHDTLDLVEADILLDSFCHNNMIFGLLG